MRISRGGIRIFVFYFANQCSQCRGEQRSPVEVIKLSVLLSLCSVCVNSCNIVSIFIGFLQKAGEQCSPLHGLTEYIISYKLLYHAYDIGKVITAGIQKLFCFLVRLRKVGYHNRFAACGVGGAYAVW